MDSETSAWEFRPFRVLLGGVLFLWAPIWFRLVERGTFREWPHWTDGPLVLSLIGSLLGGVILVGNGLGLLTSAVLADGSRGRAPTLRQFLTVYLGSIGLALTGAVLADQFLGLHPMRVAFVEIGALFLVAAFGQPWWVFATIRRLGWFSKIENDNDIRWIIGILGIVGLVAGLVVPLPPLA
jgi:hypothetical protein